MEDVGAGCVKKVPSRTRSKMIAPRTVIFPLPTNSGSKIGAERALQVMWSNAFGTDS